MRNPEQSKSSKSSVTTVHLPEILKPFWQFSFSGMVHNRIEKPKAVTSSTP